MELPLTGSLNLSSFTLPPMMSSSIRSSLESLGRNLWWSWYPEVGEIFRLLSPESWRSSDHNPVTFLRAIDDATLEERVDQLHLRYRIFHAHRRLLRGLASKDTWASLNAGPLKVQPVAYFSAEFGLHESLPIYSGGLGVLAGDHLKSASDLGVPMVGVGLLYNQGYFRQHLDAESWQHEAYADQDVEALPLSPAYDASGSPLLVKVETRHGPIHAKVWLIEVGRVRLYLMDTQVDANTAEDQQLTSRLYGGDVRTRIRQELLLGVGGVRVLEKVDLHPGVFHMNEGHSAFAALALVQQRMQREGLSFSQAKSEVAARCVFTTHTPVPAGHDRFDAQLVEEHLGPLREELGLSEHALLGLGRVEEGDADEPFCMTVLALKMALRGNGVSALHGKVSRRMWNPLLGKSEGGVTHIGHITNGVHIPTWLSPQMRSLYDRHFRRDWRRALYDADVWQDVATIPDADLWEVHQLLKLRLIQFVRRRVTAQNARRGEATPNVGEVLDENALLIGFARRFATYKRADLFLSDVERLTELVDSADRPVQFVFAGKAHPRDEGGKALLQRISRLCSQDGYRGKVVFVEDYDINVGRHLVQGVDVWLNNPRRPLEASGTSGQKVVLNGGLNFSILDGWWAEAYDGRNGFAIGRTEAHQDIAVQDQRDADALYSVLEQDILPLFYARDSDSIPREWIGRVKHAIASLAWKFSAHRMVIDYTNHCYLPAAGAVSCDMRPSS